MHDTIVEPKIAADMLFIDKFELNAQRRDKEIRHWRKLCNGHILLGTISGDVIVSSVLFSNFPFVLFGHDTYYFFSARFQCYDLIRLVFF